MPEKIAPLQQVRMGGVVTSGHPLERPRMSASYCNNFRVMPGGWLRLRSGRKTRMYQAGATTRWLQIIEFRRPLFPNAPSHLVQIYDGTDTKWRWLALSTWVFDPFFQTTINTSYGGSFVSTEAAPVTLVRDKLIIYNGLGVRSTDSKPPFSSYDGTNVVARYFGLDCYAPSANPTVAFAAGAGNNTVATSVQIWVGIYNTATGHYSNAVYAGTITTTGATGTITVSNLTNIKAAWNSTTERDELKWVFYASIDGLSVPYLILASDLSGPLTAAITATSQSLSVTAYGNGWILDLTAEAPQTNFPPRPMRQIQYLNGRIYGVLKSGGSGSVVQQREIGAEEKYRPDFDYTSDARDRAAVVWSKAASDTFEKDLLGVPEESWPLENVKVTPNSEIPLRLSPAPDGYRLLALCPTATFLLEEQADGIHEWTTVSWLHGIYRPECLQVTPFGVCWVTQRKQLVRLTPGGSLDILSARYQSLFDGKTPRSMAYISDPLNEVDRIDVHCEDGTVIHHDFRLEFPSDGEARVEGVAYTSTGLTYTSSATLMDTAEKVYHVVAYRHLYTHEGQPDDGLVVTYDRDYDEGGASTTDTEISGEYRRQWDDFGDGQLEKEIPQIDLDCDDQTLVEYYRDRKLLDAASKEIAQREQTEVKDMFRYKMSSPHMYWFKLVLKLTGRSGTYDTFAAPSTIGDLLHNFRGCVARILMTVSGQGGNRA